MNRGRENEAMNRKFSEKDLMVLLDETLVAGGEQNVTFQMMGCINVC
jgi:hypothetical protein